jgi:hypothetical protein
MNRRLGRPEYKMVALAVIGVVALLAVVIWVPKLSFIQPGGLTRATDRAKAESDLRGHLLQALAGLVLAAGAYFTGRTFALNREGQITERFTRAVEQLGNDEKLDVRLGGIYALERIARDSRTHYEPAIEVLSAFLREHAEWRPPGDEKLGLPDDLQAAAAVVGRRDRTHERPAYRLNLVRVDLSHASLAASDLADARLNQANLSAVDLSASNLSGATLSGADLTAVELGGADLSSAYITGASLYAAILSGADLRGADLSGSDLGEADLTAADLRSVRGLTQEQLDSASTDERTKIPAHLHRQTRLQAGPSE